MLAIAGISAGFEWWPMPTALAIGLLFAAGCIVSARNHSQVVRWLLWTVAVLPAVFLSFFIVKDSWQMAHPMKETWIIPAGYHGPINVVHSIPQGAIATRDRDNMVFILDEAGIAAVREPPETRWAKPTYDYRSSDGVITQIPEATTGSIDDTPANRQDKTRRIYFPGSGGFGDGSNCVYTVSEAYLESPSEALAERSSLQQVGEEQADVLEQLKSRYPGMCSITK
jgi:hypothetical protein